MEVDSTTAGNASCAVNMGVCGVFPGGILKSEHYRVEYGELPTP
ncbi:hypothetical protein SCOR_30200 [Sulfidibacter corallicola]|nr:hypothetical protein [Sulfidibacter corallicola]